MILGRLWWLVDASRRLPLNLIFLALIGLLLWAWLRPGAPRAVVDGVRRDLGWLADVSARDKPFDAAVHCLCTAP